MGLGRIVNTLLLVATLTSLSQKANSQVLLSASTGKNPTEKEAGTEHSNIKGILKPAGAPDIAVDIFVKTSLIPNTNIGELEIRKNSMYGNVLFGHYQLLFEQINDSTFVEHIFTRGLSNKSERYEIFITKKRQDANGDYYLALTEYTTTKGNKREEKIILENKTYSVGYIPAVTAMNQFFNGTLSEKVNLIVLGEPYTLTIHEKVNSVEKTRTSEIADIIQYVIMSEVTTTEYNTFIMKDDFNVSSQKKTEKVNSTDTTTVIPERFGAKFKVLNSGIWNGNYQATGIVRH